MNKEDVISYINKSQTILSKIRGKYKNSFGVTPEKTLKRMFDVEYPQLIQRQKDAWATASDAAQQHQQAEAQAATARTVKKLLGSISRNQLKKAKDCAQEAAIAIDKKIGELWTRYRIQPEIYQRAKAAANKETNEYEIKIRADNLIDRLHAIERKIQQSRGFSPAILPSLQTSEISELVVLNSIEESIIFLECYIEEKLPDDEARIRCCEATKTILPAILGTQEYPVGLLAGSKFFTRAETALANLGVSPVDHTFPALIEKMRKLKSFGNDEQWILFWSALAANRHLHREASEKDGESALTGIWLDGWERQTVSWEANLIKALRCHVAMTYGRLFDTKGDYTTGSDVMMCLCSIRNGQLGIRLVWIQFKRGLSPNDKLEVAHRQKFDQYKLLDKGHDPANGVNSLYCQVISPLSSMATTAALDITEVRFAINDQQGYDQQIHGPDQWTASDGRINWQSYAEPLATKLAEVLRPHTTTTTFSKLDDVRTWVSRTYKTANQNALPAYWVLQAMGDDAFALDKHLKNVRSEYHEMVAKLAGEFGYSYGARNAHGYALADGTTKREKPLKSGGLEL